MLMTTTLEPALSVRQVLGLERVLAGEPEVVAGAGQLDRAVRSVPVATLAGKTLRAGIADGRHRPAVDAVLRGAVTFLDEQREPLRAVVVGMPRTLLNEPTDVTSAVVGLLRTLRRELPEVPVHELDERFTSRMAHATMLAGGLGQKARRDKATVDRVSAALILQSFLESPAKRNFEG